MNTTKPKRERNTAAGESTKTYDPATQVYSPEDWTGCLAHQWDIADDTVRATIAQLRKHSGTGYRPPQPAEERDLRNAFDHAIQSIVNARECLDDIREARRRA